MPQRDLASAYTMVGRCFLTALVVVSHSVAAGARWDHLLKVHNDVPAKVYSSFRCSGTEKRVADHMGRVCIFHDVCATGLDSRTPLAPVITFYKDNLTHPLLFDEMGGYLVRFNSSDTFVDLSPRSEADIWGTAPGVRFAPDVLQGAVPAEAVRSKGVHVLWEKRLGDDNVGHVVWEDLYHIWQSLRVFQTPTKPVTVLNVGTLCSGLCAKLSSAFITVLLGKPVQAYVSWAEDIRKLAKQAEDAPICFETLVVGGYAAYLGHGNVLPHGSEPMLYEYRSEVLQAHGINSEKVPSAHHILLVNKAGSNRGSLRNIANLGEVEDFLKQTYPSIPVSVVDWAHRSVKHQFEILMSTTIVVSPSGGGSMLLPFLPLGAHAIIMDHWEQDEWDGTNRSIAMDGTFWDRWPHIKNDYYLVNSPEQQILDKDCEDRAEDDKCSNRDSARVVIDMQQLKVLIDGALAEMGLGQEFRFKRRYLGDRNFKELGY